MHLWEDRSLFYTLVRKGLPDRVTFDQSPERNERTSRMLYGGMLFQAEGKPSAIVRPLLAFLRNSKKDGKAGVI